MPGKISYPTSHLLEVLLEEIKEECNKFLLLFSELQNLDPTSEEYGDQIAEIYTTLTLLNSKIPDTICELDHLAELLPEEEPSVIEEHITSNLCSLK